MLDWYPQSLGGPREINLFCECVAERVILFKLQRQKVVASSHQACKGCIGHEECAPSISRVPMGKPDQASWNSGRKVGRTLWGPLSLLKAKPEGGWGDAGRERKLMKT